ncbi:MAG TPA: response regulator [Variovorax sp.]|nr:response regulator [Variovorax sp.]
MPSFPRPLAPTTPISIEAPTAAFERHRVLIVDTDLEATELLATLLRLSSPGIATASAHSAASAGALAREFEPDVVIIDLGSPTVSGVAVAGAVLAAGVGPRPLMIALTAGRSHLAGLEPGGLFDHVLTKPLELHALMVLIADGIPARAAIPVPGAPRAVRHRP